jgi:hypothetical protein
MRCSQAAIDLPGIPAQAIQMALSESNRTLRFPNMASHLPKVGSMKFFPRTFTELFINHSS